MNTDKIGERRAFSEGILVYCTLPAMVHGELLPPPFFRFAAEGVAVADRTAFSLGPLLLHRRR